MARTELVGLPQARRAVACSFSTEQFGAQRHLCSVRSEVNVLCNTGGRGSQRRAEAGSESAEGWGAHSGLCKADKRYCPACHHAAGHNMRTGPPWCQPL